MPENQTTFLKLIQPAVGGSKTIWGNRLNADLAKLDDNALEERKAQITSLQTGGNTGTIMDADGITPLDLDTDLRFRTAVKTLYYNDTVTKSKIGFDAILTEPTALAPVSWVMQLIDMLLPCGTIILWYGDHTNIPAGWALCNGGQPGGYQTPTLVGRYVICAWPGHGALPGGYNLNPGQSGGANGDLVHNHPIVVDNHTLTAAQIPGHVHGTNAQGGYDIVIGRTKPGGSFNFSTGGSTDGYNNLAISDGTDIAGGPGNGPHNHGASSGDSSEPPPYWALCYIMKYRAFYVPIP